MGVGLVRRAELLLEFNRLFSARLAPETARRLGPQLRSMDALEIVHRLGLLSWVRAESFLDYRARVGIPALHLLVLTSMFQAALHDRDSRGLSLEIVDGPVESVLVSEVDGHVVVKLTRTTADPHDPAVAR